MKKPDPHKAETDAKDAGKGATASAAQLLDATPEAKSDAPLKLDSVGERVDAKPADKPADKPAERPAATPAPPTPAPRETVKVIERRGGFVPMLLGGAVAAGLGAGAMYYVLPQLPEGWRPAGLATPAAPPIDTAAITAQAADAAEAAAGAGIKATSDQVTALAQEVEALKAAPVVAGEGGASALTDELMAEVQALKGQVQELASRSTAAGGGDMNALQTEARQIVAEVQQQAQAAQGQIAAAQDQAKTLMAEAEAAAKRAQGQGALASLQAAMQTGAPVAAPVAALTEAGVTVPAQIASGEVPQLDGLRADFPNAARAALAAVAAADAPNQGVLQRVGSFLKVQTGARTVGGAREGTDADAILSRAEAALVAGDVAGSLSEVATLPAPGQQAMTEWTTRAQAWVAAQEAVAKIAETLN